MNCPVCGNGLTPITAGGVTVDACKNGCGGIWFDRFELAKFDEPMEAAGEVLLHIDRNPSVTPDPGKRVNCPKCNLVMMRHFHSIKEKALVDECPGCGGTWLDAGELAAIRAQFPSDAARCQAAGAYFDGLFGGELAEMHAKSAAQAAKAQRIARMFRFICPSYYIPGKQRWGAF